MHIVIRHQMEYSEAMANDELTLGIDEAGRGPVLGPLVLCGVHATATQLQQLTALELQDSKAYGSSPKAREQRLALATKVRAICDVRVVVSEPEKIDSYAREGGLNRLEQAMASEVIDSGPVAHQIVADGQRLFGPLQKRYPQLLAQDKADRDHLVVAAASIVAKVERDRRLETLLAPYQDRFGPIRGGGYPNGATAAYLRAYVDHYGALPSGVRHSWSWAVLQELKSRIDAASMEDQP